MQSLTPQTPIRSWAVMSRLDGGQRWKIEHAENPSVTTLAELAAWGRPKQGQWSGFGKTKIAAWTSILAEAGLEWRGMAPVYPRGNPMYANITPLTEEPEDVVYRLQVAIDNDWLGRFPLTERDIIADAIREIRGLRSGQDALMDEVEIGRQAMNLARSELAAAIKQRDEARLKAQFVDSRHLFIGGSLDGARIDTDAHIYHVDGERYHRGWQMVVVTDHEDELNPLVIAKAVVYRLEGEEWRSLTTAELQRLRFVEYRRVGPLEGEGGGA